jgi:hypothetical protein
LNNLNSATSPVRAAVTKSFPKSNQCSRCGGNQTMNISIKELIRQVGNTALQKVVKQSRQPTSFSTVCDCWEHGVEPYRPKQGQAAKQNPNP